MDYFITDETAVTDDNGRTSIYGRGGDWYWTIPGGWGLRHNGQTKWWIRWKQTGVNYQHIYCTGVAHRSPDWHDAGITHPAITRA